MTIADTNLTTKAARVITAIDKMNEDHPKLKSVFEASATSEEKEKILDLKVAFATRAADFVEKSAKFAPDAADKIIALAELEARIMSRAIGEIETRAFVNESDRSDDVSSSFEGKGASTLASIHRPSFS